MSSKLEQLRDEYFEAVKLYLWYSPSRFSFFQGKKSVAQAAQQRVSAQVAWVRYQEEKNG